MSLENDEHRKKTLVSEAFRLRLLCSARNEGTFLPKLYWVEDEELVLKLS